MSRRDRGGPVCHKPQCREARLQYATDTNGIARQRCPSCGESRAIPRNVLAPLFQPHRLRRGA